MAEGFDSKTQNSHSLASWPGERGYGLVAAERSRSRSGANQREAIAKGKRDNKGGQSVKSKSTVFWPSVTEAVRPEVAGSAYRSGNRFSGTNVGASGS